jgi:hypothetical protein
VTANCFCTRAALETVGGFDERFTAAWREDSDLQFSLLRSGFRIGRAAGALVIHPIRPAPWGVSLSQQRKSQFDILLSRKHPELYRERIPGFPPLYVAINCAAAIGIAAALLGQFTLAVAMLVGWCLLTGWFFMLRTRETSHRPSHLVEMAVTSALIPLLSLHWRLWGLWRFRTCDA